jgi:hypothetical protein
MMSKSGHGLFKELFETAEKVMEVLFWLAVILARNQSTCKE